MHLAVDGSRVAEGLIGAVLLLAAVSAAVIAALHWRQRRRVAEEPSGHELARFVDSPITDLTTFGGGATAARLQRRRDTVTYGYLAVAEQYCADGGSDAMDEPPFWCTLTVTLPGRVPLLVVEDRNAAGRPGVPLDVPHAAELDDPAFDATYAAGAEEPWLLPRILTPAVRELLVDERVQRLMLRESTVLVRTHDGVALDDAVVAGLDAFIERFLTSTPSFLLPSRTAAGPQAPPSDTPLPQGFYGPD